MYDKPVSYSGLSLYKSCPLLWKEAYIDGIREPSGPAAERGTRLHDSLEKYFKGETTYPSANSTLAPWKNFMEGLFALAPTAEGEVAMDSDWRPTSFDDKKAHFRGKVDLSLPGVIFDWKSGRIYPDHEHQAEAYVALSAEPVELGYFVYLDHPTVVHRYRYTVQQQAELREKLDSEIYVLRTDQDFLPKMGPRCDWCKKSWRRGGDCRKAP